MKLQIIFDADGKIVHSHYFGFVSENLFVSRLRTLLREKFIDTEGIMGSTNEFKTSDHNDQMSFQFNLVNGK